MGTYGPNDADVRRMIERVRALSAEDAQAILEARIAWVNARAANDSERIAQRRAVRVARRSRRFEAYLAARHAAAEAFRLARRGEIGRWLGVSAAIASAAGAVVLADLLDVETYEALYRPWRIGASSARLVAVGPGAERPAFGIAPRRRPTALFGSGASVAADEGGWYHPPSREPK